MSNILIKAQKAIFYKLNRKLENLCWLQLNPSWKLRSGFNVEIKSEAEWVIYNDIFVDGEYDLPIKKTLNTSNNHPIRFLDIGANVGFFTFRVADLAIQTGASDRTFEVILVEGSPTLYKELKSRFSSEVSRLGKFEAIHGLVGKRQGSGKILEIDFHVMNSTLPSNSTKGVDVPYINLMELYPGNTEIDLLKCDIEGSELDFLENYKDLLSQVKSAVFELHHTKCDTRKCFEILHESGFKNHQRLRDESMYSLDFFWK